MANGNAFAVLFHAARARASRHAPSADSRSPLVLVTIENIIISESHERGVGLLLPSTTQIPTLARRLAILCAREKTYAGYSKRIYQRATNTHYDRTGYSTVLLLDIQ